MHAARPVRRRRPRRLDLRRLAPDDAHHDLPGDAHHDLPGGGRRLLQRAEAYRHTLVRGVETYTDGEETGELPGRLIRGPQAVPA